MGRRSRRAPALTDVGMKTFPSTSPAGANEVRRQACLPYERPPSSHQAATRPIASSMQARVAHPGKMREAGMVWLARTARAAPTGPEARTAPRGLEESPCAEDGGCLAARMAREGHQGQDLKQHLRPHLGGVAGGVVLRRHLDHVA